MLDSYTSYYWSLLGLALINLLTLVQYADYRVFRCIYALYSLHFLFYFFFEWTQEQYAFLLVTSFICTFLVFHMVWDAHWIFIRVHQYLYFFTPEKVIDTLLSSRKPVTRRIYAKEWGVFSRWCRERGTSQQEIPMILDFLQDGADQGLAAKTLKVQVAALSCFLDKKTFSWSSD